MDLLQVSSDPGKQYNVSVMNALVLYVGTQSIAYIHSKGGTPSPSTIAHTAHMDIFQHLVVDLDTEGGMGIPIQYGPLIHFHVASPSQADICSSML